MSLYLPSSLVATKKQFVVLLLLVILLITGHKGFATNYYNLAASSGSLQDVNSWGVNPNGSGSHPGGFTSSADTFFLYNGTTGTISGPWIINSATLKVGTGSAPFNLTIPAAFSLTGSGAIDINAQGTVTNQNTTNPNYVTLDPASTVDFNGTGAQTVGSETYGNVIISGTRVGTPVITISGTVNIAGSFTITESGAVSYTTTSSTVRFTKSTGGQVIPSVIPYASLTLLNSSGTNTVDGNISVTTTFTTTAGGTLNMGIYALTVATVSSSGIILTQNTSATPFTTGKSWGGTVDYNAATGGQTVIAGTYSNLSVGGTSGTNTAAGTLTVNATLTVPSGTTLDMSTRTLGGTVTPAISGILSTSSTATTPITSGKIWGGTVIFARTTGSQRPPAGTYNNVTMLNSSGTNTARGVMTINGALITTAGGIFSMASNQMLGTLSSINNAGEIQTTSSSNPAIPANKTWNGTVTFARTSTTQSVPAGTYSTLKINNAGSTASAVGAIVINTLLNISSSTSIFNMATFQLTGGFSVTNNGNFYTSSTANPPYPAGLNWTGTTGLVRFVLTTGGQFVPAGTYKSLTFSNSSGTNTAVGNITMSGGTYTSTAGGTLDMGTTNILSGSATYTNLGTLKTSVPTATSATPIPAGVAWGGTVNYASLTGGQTIVSAVSYTNLTNSATSGSNTSADNLTVNGVLTTTAGGTLDLTANYRLLGTLSTITNNGIIKTSVPTATSSTPIPTGRTWGGTIIYGAAAGAQTIVAATSYNKLTLLNTSGTHTASSNIVVNGTLTTTAGGTLDMTGAYTLSGTLATIVNDGTIRTSVPTATSAAPIASGKTWGGSGTVIYALSTGAQTLVSGTYNSLTLLNTSGTNTAGGVVNVNGVLTTTSGGIVDMGTFAMGGAPTGVVNNGTIVTSTVTSPALPSGEDWSGTTGLVRFALTTGGQFVPAGTFGDLTFSNTSGTNTAVGAFAVNGDLITTSGGLLNMSTFAMSGSPTSVTNNGRINTASTTNPALPIGENWTGTTGIVAFTATAGGQFAPGGTYKTLSFANTSGTNTVVGGDLTVSSSLTATGGSLGSLDMGTNQLVGPITTFANTGTILTQNTGSTAIPSGLNFPGTVNYNAATGGQTIVTQTSYTNLTLGNTSGSTSPTANLVVNGALTTSGGVLDMNAFTLSGTLTSITGTGSILTANTSAAPVKSGQTWTQEIEYDNAAGSQTIVSGTYNGGLTNSNTSGTNTVVAGGSVSVPGTLTLTGGSALADNGVTINVAGNIAGTGTHTGAGRINMTGSGKTISGATFSNLQLNNSGGFSLSGNAQVNGTLTMTSGRLDIGANDLILGSAAAAISGSFSSSTMIVANGAGKVRKQFSATGSYLFPIGDNTPTYSPITLNITSGSFAGGADAAVNVTKAKHPQNASTTNYLNRYWSVNLSGITSPAYTATATYVVGDVAGTEASISEGAYPGSLPWIKYSAVNTGTHTLTTTSLSAANADFSGIASANSTISVSPTNSSFCSGGSATLTATPSGTPSFTYTWAPATGLSATTGASVVAAPTTSTVTVTYVYTVTMTDGNGLLATATSTVVVAPLPTAIGGTTTICSGATSSLTNGLAGGIWLSSATGVATIGSASGLMTGVAQGTTIITYATSSGCQVTTTAMVKTTPSAIAGISSQCNGSTTTYTNTALYGLWSSSNDAVASVGSTTGIVTGVALGTAIITYNTGCGAAVTKQIDITSSPITGVFKVCNGATTTLSNVSSGGVWSSANPGVATVGSLSGDVTGITGGTTTISYAVGSCAATATFTVNVQPAATTGTPLLCEGATTTLSNTVPFGVWYSSNPAIATVGSANGLLTGVSAGNTLITYTTGCGTDATVTATINTTPAAISGSSPICFGLTYTFTNATPGGAWTSSNSGVASVGSGTGIVSGVATGTAIITYGTSAGCQVTTTVTVNPLLPISGAGSVCAGSTITLTDATAGGAWSSSATGVATVGTASGIVTGVGAGTTTISYLLPSGCLASVTVTVNPLPSAISGTTTVCVNATSTLTNSGGGAWLSSNTGVATIGSGTGIMTGVAAGTTIITYTLPTTCQITTTALVNPVPAAIGGTAQACVGFSTTLTDATGTGTWSSSATGVATIGSSSGILTAVSSGTSVVTYQLSTGCFAVKVATVNPLPGSITGASSVCEAASITLSNGSAGGTWSSSDISHATIGSASGIVTGVASGTATITYSLPTGCIATRSLLVNPIPASITGTTDLCAGFTTTLSNSTGGGTWSSSNTIVARVGSTTGIVSGASSGLATITYTIATGCYNVTGVNVNALITPILSNAPICIGETVTLTNSTGGGTWRSTSPGVATIGSTTGVVTGIASGTSLVSYTMPGGCIATTVTTVNPLPSAISGPSSVCENYSVFLTNVGGGIWNSDEATVTVDNITGEIGGVTAGTAIITYTLPTGCYTSKTMSVLVTPSDIAGDFDICEGATTTLTDPDGGGTWSSSNLSFATVGSVSGIVTGISTGTLTISYSFSNGCAATEAFVVNPLPNAITGTSSLCQGATTTYTNTGGGAWISSAPSVATIDISTGVVTGVTLGTVTITYTLTTGCYITKTATVFAAPSAITGTAYVCQGQTTTLSNSGGGTWTSANTGVATIGSSTGVVSGIASGTSTITYMLATGCIATTVVTVNPLPSATSGTLAVCSGQTTTLTNSGGGEWVSSSVGIATIGSTTGVLTGISAGTSFITYTLPTGCYTVSTATINPLPGAITGSSAVCTGLTTTLSNAGGGTWMSSTLGVATIGSTTGVVTGVAAGTTVVTYTLPTGCVTTTIVTVNPLPTAITGSTTICSGQTTTLSNSGGGTWLSATPGVATIGSSTGVMTGVSAGTSTITYTLHTGCMTTTVVTVNSLPNPITGTLFVCETLTTTLSNTGGGTWSSSNTGIATIGSSTGVVSGVASGTATITYSLGTGCITTSVFTVNPLPSAITGTASACVGSQSTLSNAGGGTWSSNNIAIATVGSSTGTVTGVLSGTVTITYTLPTGCITTTVFTVNPLPSAITGITAVCEGLTTSLSNSGGGTWSSSALGVATIGSASGIATGVSAGTSVITYTLGTGCIATTVVTVQPLPAAIGGLSEFCELDSAYYTNATVGGIWSSSTLGVATIGSVSGSAYGVAPGTVTFTYTMGSGCNVTKSATVNPKPAAVIAPASVCQGVSVTFTDATPGGTWNSTDVTVATVGSLSGVVTAVRGYDTTFVQYILPTGCLSVERLIVDSIPGTISGASAICDGLTTTFSSATSGGVWSSSDIAVATVGSGTGLVAGESGGTATITYAIPTGCYVTKMITVNDLPSGISGTLSVCSGLTSTLTGAGGGTWSSSNSGVATIGSSTGIVTGVSAGTARITYVLATGCHATATFTVNPLPGAITGSSNGCLGQNTVLTNTGGGTWLSSNLSVATIGSTTGLLAGVSLGTALITYTLPTGCITSTSVLINPLPAAVSGPTDICTGFPTTYTNSTGGGVWSSSNTAVATVGTASGIVTGILSGTAMITYTLGTGCYSYDTININELLSPILGRLNVCEGLPGDTLSHAILGGDWVSSNTAVATIGSAIGDISGIAAGTTVISYYLPTGCIATSAVTVNPLPAAISGPLTVCEQSNITLTDAGGGTWSSSDLNANINLLTGVVTGMTAGTSTITYTLPTGCIATRDVEVLATPDDMVGSFEVCAGFTTTLSDSTAGGVWSSSLTGVATIGSATGLVTGISGGTSTISYTLSNGCYASVGMLIDPFAAPITGSDNVCLGTPLFLDDTDGGTWTINDTTIATIDYFSGAVTGVTYGTATVTFTLLTGCYSTKTITVNALPTAISGATVFCSGVTTTLTNATPGGTWLSSDISVATIGSATGVVNTVSLGVTTITYTVGTGCITTTSFAVHPLPFPIVGVTSICNSDGSTLSNSGGGVWSSSNIAVATIGTSTGDVATVSVGTSTITYTLPTGCYTTSLVTVNPLPATITGTLVVCTGYTTALANGTGGGTWISDDAAIASVNNSTGVATGVSAGTVLIDYILPTGCYASATLTVNATPASVTGTTVFCEGDTATLYSSGVGVWSSSVTGVATIGSVSGFVDAVLAGTSAITYTLGTGCYAATTITVNPMPAIITGTTTVCSGSSITLSNATPGGIWSSTDITIADIGSTSGVITSSLDGVAYIHYTLPGGCFAVEAITVNPLPSAIGGTTTVCEGLTTTLTNTGGGTWSSSSTGVATIGSSTGIATGVAAGTSTITYTLGTGCINTTVLTVNATPSPIGGTTTVCEGLTTTLTNTGGGTWSSSSTGVATIGSSTGIATGVAAGTSTITYTLGTGCINTTVLTVNPLPSAIGGTTTVCEGLTTTLTNTGGGTWSSSTTGVATIGTTTGVATGVSAGTSTITYSLGTGCITTTVLTVNPTPSAISGTTTVCRGATTSLSNSGGGTWSSSSTGIATIGSSTGIATGVAAGTATITYTLGTGCTTTTALTVNASPSAIGGSMSACVGSLSALTNSVSGGVWSSTNTGIATIGSSTGIVTAVSTGTSTISYVLSTGCSVASDFTANTAVPAITGTTTVCAGSVTTLSNSVGGGNWTSSNIAIATVGSTTGDVLGVFGGSATITYSTGTSCYATTSVNIGPILPITGGSAVCVGYNLYLADATPGGTWSTTGSSAIATLGTLSGIVTGVSLGTIVVTYTVPSGCTRTTTINVTTPPGPIVGSSFVCTGQSVTYTNAVPGGLWSSSNGGLALMDTYTGVLTGRLSGGGPVVVSYSFGYGCLVSTTVAVNPISSIVGSTTVCEGQSITLTNGTSGGAWVSSNSGIASAGSTGSITGVSAGTSMITYLMGTGCMDSMSVRVYPLAAMTGLDNVCIGQSITLADATPGGAWTSSNGGIATVSSGLVTGVMPGTAIISYTIISTGCVASKTVTVNNLGTTYGPTTVCANQTITLGNSVSGGSWISGGSVATVGSTTGVVTGVAAGTEVITYMMSSGCYTTYAVSVHPLAATTGLAGACVGQTTTLSNATGGGVWITANGGIADVGTTTGVVTGIGAGTTTIGYYVAATGCTYTTTVTISALSSIVGASSACVGQTTTLTSGTGGGTWISSNTLVASVGSSTGVVTGVAAGTAVITYQASLNCSTTATITINPLAPIAGTTTICSGLSYTLSDAVGGGTWTSSNGGIALIGSTTGIVVGNISGTATISYTLGTGCVATTSVTVNPLSPVSGAGPVCKSSTLTLTDATAGGTWESADATVTIGSATGIVTGVTAGTALVSYIMPTGCIANATVTVLPSEPITGTTTVCASQTTTLANAVSGGTWTTGNGAIASVGSTTGIVTGILAGNVNITYTLSNGCVNSTSVTVNNFSSITGTTSVCNGQTTTLANSVSGGTWSSSATAVGTISAVGLVTGISAGTTVISYTLSTGCSGATVVTVNPVAAIAGTTPLCMDQTNTYTNAVPGGTWTSSNSAIASVGSSTGVVTAVAAGSATITYSLATGCYSIKTVTVNTSYAITGSSGTCVGSTITLASFAGGGVWTSGSTGVATIGSSTGVVTGVSAGSSVITYTLSSGCVRNTTVSIITTPPTITGTTSACTGTSTTLSNAISGGVWTSGNVLIATVGSTTGVVTGTSYGTVSISYTLGSCRTTIPVTIASLGAITGTASACVGQTTTLNGTGGGTWSSSDLATATVGSATGVVTGVAAGTAVISYTIGSGCSAVRTVTINPLVAITGATTVCTGQTTTLSNAVAGGTWASNNTLRATIGSATGVVTGVGSGLVTFTYTLGTGCRATASMTVNPSATLTGATSVCAGQTTTFTSTVSGGTWTSGTTGVATVGSSTGIVTGVATGSATITYALSTGCQSTKTISVSDLAAISGSSSVCLGQSTTLTNSVAGGTWSSGNMLRATVGSATGVVSGIGVGAVAISYTLGSGCRATLTVTVGALSAITGTPSACVGLTSTLATTTSGGSWISSNTGVATIGSSSGTLTGISAGTSTISYVMPTGCMNTVVATISSGPASISGPSFVCSGQTAQLTNSSPGGAWTSSNGGLALVGSTGIVTGRISGATVTISYSFGSGCVATKTMVVNPFSPIYGPTMVCTGQTITMTAGVAGGAWSSSSPALATIGSSTAIVTGVSAGTAFLTYTMPTGCVDTSFLTINPLSTVVGASSVCVGQSITLTDATPGGTWYTSNGGLALIGSTTGVVTGRMAGGGAVVISYRLSTGCTATQSVTVNDLSPIQLPTDVCNGFTRTLANASSGGTWSSSNPSIASIGSTTGVVTGVANGVATVSYVITSTGCTATESVVVTSCRMAGDTASETATATAADFTVVPNPNNGEFVLKGNVGVDKDMEVVIDITNMLGRIVYTHKMNAQGGLVNDHIVLDEGMAKGMYLITVRYEGGSKVMYLLINK